MDGAGGHAPIEPGSLAEPVANRLLDMILARSLTAVDMLPPERELTMPMSRTMPMSMQISRPSVRDVAMAALAMRALMPKSHRSILKAMSLG